MLASFKFLVGSRSKFISKNLDPMVLYGLEIQTHTPSVAKLNPQVLMPFK